MSTDEFSLGINERFATYLLQNEQNNTISVAYENIDYSSDESSSSSSDEIFLENYTTKRQIYASNNDPLVVTNYKSISDNLAIIFERSNESSLSSSSSLVNDSPTKFDYSTSSQGIVANHFLCSDDDNNEESTTLSSENQPIRDKSNTIIDCYNNNNTSSVTVKSNSDSELCEEETSSSLDSYNLTNTMLNNISSDSQDTIVDSGVDISSAYTQASVYNWNAIDNKPSSSLSSSSSLSQSDLIVNKRTPRFPITKNHSNSLTDGEKISLIDKSDNVSAVNNKCADSVSKKSSTFEEQQQLMPDLEQQSLVNCVKSDKNNINNNNNNNNNSITEIKLNRRYEKRDDRKKAAKPLDKGSPCRKSQEFNDSIMKMDNTIDRVTDNIVKIDCVIDKMTVYNREKPTPTELGRNFLMQTDTSTDKKRKMHLARNMERSSPSESSTEKDTESDADQCVSLKPSPIHQVVPGPTNKPIGSLKSQIQQGPLSCDVPSQIKRIQHPIQRVAGPYKSVPNTESPTRLNVPDNGQWRGLGSPVPPQPSPRSRRSIDGSSPGTFNRHMSTSSSESSSNHEHQRTLSNSKNHNLSTTNSPGGGNSDSGSFLSFNSNNNQIERKIQKSGPSVKNMARHKGSDNRFGSLPRNRKRVDGEVASLTSDNDPLNRFLISQSRSYNSLNALHLPLDNPKLHSGSLAAINNNGNMYDTDGLCHLIQQHLSLNSYDRIKSIFKSLMYDHDQDRIENIIDHFEGRDRSILLEMVTKSDFGLKCSESMFDMTMSRTDLQNNLRPGLSLSSLNDSNYQHSFSTEKMIFWRADIDEVLPPPMKQLPKPLPTNLLKSAIISSESIHCIDTKVIETLEFEPTTFTELVLFLTRDCTKDVEKVRALFRWITMYDIKHLNFDPAAPSETLVGALRAIKSGQMSYNELFFRMCRFAGIHCQFISGYSKGAGYRPGMPIKDNRMFRNVWTAVYVAGAWRLVNCNWGARYLSSCRRHHQPYDKHLSVGSVSSSTTHVLSIEKTYPCDEFYFLTDPKQHIFEHFPDKKRWQLLNRPITLDQFIALPIVKSPFFNVNLSFQRNYPETLRTRNGKVTVKLNMPKSVGISCRLENTTDNTVLRGLTLIRVLDNQMIMVTAAPSQPGSFYLSIYVSNNWRSDDGRELACSFQVHCSEHNFDRLATGMFPDVGVLGPTPMAQKLGVIVNEAVDPFVIWDERSTMKLNVAISGTGRRIGHKLMSYDRSGQTGQSCDNYALLQCHGQVRHQYHVRFPVDSFYCLTVFANSNEQSSTMDSTMAPMECIYRLLIDCRHAQDRIPPFPRQTCHWVGLKLIEPVSQHLELNQVYRFRIISLHCTSLAVVINDNKWFDLTLTGDGLWKAKINTGAELDRLSLYGKFADNRNDDEFVKLLDYVLVAGTNNNNNK